MTRYKGDPYWLTARYPGKCAKCGRAFTKGTDIFRYKDGTIYADTCAEAASREFEAAAADEDLYSYSCGY